MDEVDYWMRQILMYWGLPNDLVTEEEAERAPLADLPAPRVLHPADEASLPRILAGLHALPARWTDAQWDDVTDLVRAPVDLAVVSFVENRVRLAYGCGPQWQPRFRVLRSQQPRAACLSAP
jgi:hypothetical protein